MSADQTTAELTTRDVLLQVDRRLTLIEEDLRSLDDKVDGLDDKLDNRIGALDAKLGSRIGALDDKMDSRIEGLRTKMDNGFEALGAKLDARLDFHLKWTLGTMISLTGLTLTVFGLVVVFLKL